MAIKRNEIGIRYGRMLVIAYASIQRDRHTRLVCRCDCWKEKEVYQMGLRCWDIKSCGCLGIEKRRAWLLKHWLSKTPLYLVFQDMKRRCEVPMNANYKYYWWRGIKCEWENVESFIQDMSKWYKKWLQIDRINNDWNYCKENCRWATPAENNRNRSNLVIPWWLAEYCREHNLRYAIVGKMLRSWKSLEEATTLGK
jgi:hypothetical protein